MYASEVNTGSLAPWQFFVRIYRERGSDVGLVRDAYKETDVVCIATVRILCVQSYEGGPAMIKRGSKVRVVKMDTAGGMDWQAKRLEGKVFTVRFIDSAGQIHFEETGLALIPGVDQFEVVK